MENLEWKHDEHQKQEEKEISGKKIVCATLAGVAIAGPLIGMMGLTSIASLTLLLVTSPLFIIFSPLLFFVSLLFLAVMTGFGITLAMAVAAVCTLGSVLGRFEGNDFGGYLHHQNGFGQNLQFFPKNKAVLG